MHARTHPGVAAAGRNTPVGIPVEIDVPLSETRSMTSRVGPGGDPTGATTGIPVIEQRGRRWIVGSFLLCPCHLPLTLAILASLAGGTVIGGLLRDHVLLAGLVISLGWVAGTANGFRLVRHAQRGTCPVPLRARWRAKASNHPR